MDCLEYDRYDRSPSQDAKWVTTKKTHHLGFFSKSNIRWPSKPWKHQGKKGQSWFNQSDGVEPPMLLEKNSPKKHIGEPEFMAETWQIL